MGLLNSETLVISILKKAVTFNYIFRRTGSH